MTTVWVLVLWWGAGSVRIGEYPSVEECEKAVALTIGTLGTSRLGSWSCTPMPKKEWKDPPP